jgi:hypothetical protein
MPLATASRRRAPVQGDAGAVPSERIRPAFMPTLSRRGRPALAAAGLLIVLVCAAAGAGLAGSSGHQQPYLAVVQAVPDGAPVEAADLGTVDLDPTTGLSLLPAADENAVIGKRAAALLPAGTLLDPAALTSGAAVPAGDAVVGASLEPQQVPAEVQAGDSVLLVLTGDASTGTAGASGGAAGAAGGASHVGAQPGDVLADGTVLDVVPPGASGLGSAPTSSTTIVDLAVPVGDAPAVTAASAAGDLGLAVVPAATTAGRRP